MAKELLKREEVRVEDTWNLSDMYETAEDWENAIEEIDELIDEIEAMESTCTNSASELLLLLEKSAEVDEKLSLAYNYAERLFDEDRKNTKHQAMSAKAGTVYAKLVAKLLLSSRLFWSYLQKLSKISIQYYRTWNFTANISMKFSVLRIIPYQQRWKNWLH